MSRNGHLPLITFRDELATQGG